MKAEFGKNWKTCQARDFSVMSGSHIIALSFIDQRKSKMSDSEYGIEPEIVVTAGGGGGWSGWSGGLSFGSGFSFGSDLFVFQLSNWPVPVDPPAEPVDPPTEPDDPPAEEGNEIIVTAPAPEPYDVLAAHRLFVEFLQNGYIGDYRLTLIVGDNPEVSLELFDYWEAEKETYVVTEGSVFSTTQPLDVTDFTPQPGVNHVGHDPFMYPMHDL